MSNDQKGSGVYSGFQSFQGGPSSVPQQAPDPPQAIQGKDELVMISVRVPRSSIAALESECRTISAQYYGQNITISGLIRGIVLQHLQAKGYRV